MMSFTRPRDLGSRARVVIGGLLLAGSMAGAQPASTRPAVRVRDVSASAGESFTCALGGAPPAVYCWGANGEGQLGIGRSERSEPAPRRLAFTALAQGDSVVGISAGASPFACAVTGTGRAYCWGSNGSGELGDGSVVSRPVPTRVRSTESFTSVGTGDEMACALARDGRAYCWGNNEDGQLGAGDTAEHHAPTPVATDSRFMVLSVGAAGSTCGITTSRELLCWGRSVMGDRSDDAVAHARPSPLQPPSGASFVDISVGNGFACAITADLRT